MNYRDCIDYVFAPIKLIPGDEPDLVLPEEIACSTCSRVGYTEDHTRAFILPDYDYKGTVFSVDPEIGKWHILGLLARLFGRPKEATRMGWFLHCMDCLRRYLLLKQGVYVHVPSTLWIHETEEGDHIGWMETTEWATEEQSEEQEGWLKEVDAQKYIFNESINMYEKYVEPDVMDLFHMMTYATSTLKDTGWPVMKIKKTIMA